MKSVPCRMLAAAIVTASTLVPAAPAQAGAAILPQDVPRVACTTTPVAPVEAEVVELSQGGSRVALRSDFDPLGRNDDRSDEIFLWHDGAGLLQLTDTPRFQGLVEGPAVSASGDRVSLGWTGDPVGGNGDGSMEVFLWDIATGFVQVTDTPEGFVARVGISPNGRRVVFEATSDPLGTNADGSHELFVWGPELGLVQITDHETSFERASFWATSADGSRIAFQHNPGGLIERISLWDEDAGVIPIAASDTTSSFGPAISAEGRRVSFISRADLAGENPDGGFEVFLWESGAGLTQITDSPDPTSSISNPSMSGGGNRIAFSADADLVGENPDGGQEVFLWREDQGLEQITDWHGPALHSLGPRLSYDGFWIAFSSRADLVGLNPAHLFKAFLWGEGFGTTQVTRSTLGMSFVAGISGNGRRVAIASRPFPQPSDPEEGFEVAVADCDEPQPPPGPWLESAAVPGFRFKVQILDGDGFILDGALEPDCIPETLCVSGAVPGRTEAFLRVLGPRPNNQLWAVLAKFSTSTLHVWIEQEATTLDQFYVLPGAQPRVDLLPGLVDRHAFPPVPVPDGVVAGPGHRAAGLPPVLGLDLPAEWVAAAEAPEPPPGPYLTTPELPGFRVKARITPRGGEPQAVRRETDCVGETLCVSGALPGRSELFVRVVGPKPNGRLWPHLVRLTPSEIEVWIEQEASGELRYYRLRPLSPTGVEIPGLFDRVGFLP